MSVDCGCPSKGFARRCSRFPNVGIGGAYFWPLRQEMRTGWFWYSLGLIFRVSEVSWGILEADVLGSTYSLPILHEVLRE